MIRKININLNFEVDVCGDAPDEVLLDEVENYLMSNTTICVDNENINLQIFSASMEIIASAIEPYLPANEKLQAKPTHWMPLPESVKCLPSE